MKMMEYATPTLKNYQVIYDFEDCLQALISRHCYVNWLLFLTNVQGSVVC